MKCVDLGQCLKTKTKNLKTSFLSDPLIIQRKHMENIRKQSSYRDGIWTYN